MSRLRLWPGDTITIGRWTWWATSVFDIELPKGARAGAWIMVPRVASSGRGEG